MISRNEIIKAHPIDVFLEKEGLILSGTGAEKKCCCPFHDDKEPSFRVNLEKQCWYCDPCGFGGSVIDFVVRRNGVSVKEAIIRLAQDAGLLDSEWDTKKQKVATYEYRDQYGRTIMYVDRIEQGAKKEFFPHQIDAEGNRINNIAGIQRVLYRMEQWSGKKEVALVEGEKCVHAMESIGFDATSCAGGANGWLDAYAAYLRDKHVDIWPDNDEAGDKWLSAVLSSLAGKVATLRIMRAPRIYGDIADLIDAQGREMGLESISKIMANTARIERGVMLPLLSANECWELYRRRVNESEKIGIDLGKWLPSLRACTRKLLPGDMVVVMSDTGVGKTTILSNIAYSQRPLPIILFELELSPEAMAERFISRDMQLDGFEVENTTRRGQIYPVDRWNHIYICPESKLTINDMENIITQSELKIQQKPCLVLVDYIGLMKGGEGKRYERLSSIAEGLKMLARTTNTVVIIASQISRDKERKEVGLHDAKDSGSIENSAQLVIGAWREAENKITLSILKQTKRAGKVIIPCNFDGNKQTIRESHPGDRWSQKTIPIEKQEEQVHDFDSAKNEF